MADEGGLKSAGVAGGRAAMLLGTAVLVGLLLLNSTDAEQVSVSPTTLVDGSGGEDLPGADEVPDDPTPEARPPGEVKVLVANATRSEGAASRVTEKLRLAGYNVVPPTDAAKEDATIVYFTTGYEAEAKIVAQALELAPTAVQPLPAPPPISDLRDATVLVLVGPELAASTASTTTAPGAKTTTAPGGAKPTTAPGAATTTTAA